MDTRRSFLKKVAITGAMGLNSSIIASAMSFSKSSKIALRENDTVLFQGDSITDAGREKKTNAPNTSQMLGSGYVMLTASALLQKYAEKKLSIYNKGNSGSKVFELADRWDNDCLNIQPNVLSILIGVNDFCHIKLLDYKGTPAIYEADYRTLLQRTQLALPDVKIIIGEPFAVNKGVKDVNDKWYVDDSWWPEFNRYRTIAQNLAAEFNAAFIPYQKIFDEALNRAPASYWTPDGIHVSLAGAQLMADAWMQVIA
jgi:lysophospholipase L1-like esterase